MKNLGSTVFEDCATNHVRVGARMPVSLPGCLHLVTTHDLQNLRTALANGRLPTDFEAKLARLGEDNLIERFVAQNSRLFIALLLAAGDGSFALTTPAERERLLRVLAYVRKDDDAIPDYRPGGFNDDQQEVRAATTELNPLLQNFKAWRLCHQVPGMWWGSFRAPSARGRVAADVRRPRRFLAGGE